MAGLVSPPELFPSPSPLPLPLLALLSFWLPFVGDRKGGILAEEIGLLLICRVAAYLSPPVPLPPSSFLLSHRLFIWAFSRLLQRIAPSHALARARPFIHDSLVILRCSPRSRERARLLVAIYPRGHKSFRHMELYR